MLFDGAAGRLKEERERLGMSQAAFSEIAEVSKNTQLAYEKGTSPITLQYLGLLASSGLDIEYVIFGRRSRERRTHRQSDLSRESDMVEVAQIDLRFGLGGAVMDQEIVESRLHSHAFPREWLRQITSSPASELYWAQGQGNSMEPAIHDGDIILIDRSQRVLAYGDLCWAVAYGQIGMIKRLRPMPDGSIKILSDNPNVTPEIAYDGELNIFGRVVAVVRTI